MKKGEAYEGTVKRLNFPNKGILAYENEEEGTRNDVMVKNTLPGQKVRFQLTKKRHGGMEGRLLQVIEQSPMENGRPFCTHFGDCGGCSYQTMDYGNQLNLKCGQVKDLLDGVCETYEFEGILGSPSIYSYRNKMEFSFGDEQKGGPLTLGLHKQGSFYDILQVTDCQIVHSDVNRIVVGTKDYFTKLGVGFYHKISREGYLRHLMVRHANHTGEMLVCLVTTTKWKDMENGKEDDIGIGENGTGEYRMSEQRMLDGYRDMLLDMNLKSEIKGILHIKNDSLSDVVKSDETIVLYGRDYIKEILLMLMFRITPFSFFQTNTLGAEVLYAKVKEYMGEVDQPMVLDLYSGTGTIAQILAPIAKKVVGVEIVEEAVEAARMNASANGLDNCEFIAGDVLKVLKEWEGKPDFIVLDPPREGVHPKALKRIMEFGVERMVYVSCKPTSLVRDLEMLKEGGYRVRRAVCVDMFAWGRNVETITLLCR